MRKDWSIGRGRDLHREHAFRPWCQSSARGQEGAGAASQASDGRDITEHAARGRVIVQGLPALRSIEQDVIG